MIKDTNGAVNLPEDTQAARDAADLFNSYLNAPVTKLDADEYSAQDLDGVTESVLGSGNMNFMMMQAGQTDEAIAASRGYAPIDNALAFSAATLPPTDDLPAPAGTNAPNSGNDVQSFAAPAAAGGGNARSIEPATNENAAFSTQNKASAASPVVGYAAPVQSSASSANATDGTSSTTTNNTTNGGDTTTIINNTTNTTTTNNTVINEYSTGDTITIINNEYNGTDTTTILETVENIYNNTTTTITNITENLSTDLTEIVNNTVNNVTDITENLTEVINNTVNNVTDITDNLTEIINNTVTNVTSIVNNVPDGLPLDDLGPIGLDLDLALSDLTSLNLDVIGLGGVTNVIDTVLDLTPILDPVTNLTGDLLTGVSVLALLDPFNPDTSANDTDLNIGVDLGLLNLPIPDLALDIPLDPVESLLGDIDLSLDVTEQLLNILPPVGGGNNPDTDLGLDLQSPELLAPALDPVLDLAENTVNGVFNPVEDLAGDIDIGGEVGLELLGIGDAGNDAPGTDSDISIPLNLDLVDSDLLDNALDINLDPIEHLTGDIDLDLGIAGDVLGQTADNLIDGFSGGTGTDNLLSGIGDIAGAIVGETLTGIEDFVAVPDLVSDISFDLLAPDANPESDTDLTLDIALIDPVEINLDLVESIAGDLDIGINAENIAGSVMDTLETTLDTAICLLGNTQGGGLGELPGLSSLLGGDGNDGGGLPGGSWTETLLPDVGNLLGGGLGDLGGLDSVIPDPVLAAPVIPLPLPLPALPLLGGHHGGLFG